MSYCEEEFKKAQTINLIQMNDWHDVPWTEFFSNQSPKQKIPPTGIDIATIKTICIAISTSPKDIECHAQVSYKLYELYHGNGLIFILSYIEILNLIDKFNLS